jgi:hypothetical protein
MSANILNKAVKETMIRKSIRTIKILFLPVAFFSLVVTAPGSTARAEVQKNRETAEVEKGKTPDPALEHEVSLRNRDIYNQLDFTGGVFVPAGRLADGMDAGWAFSINIRTPFTRLVPLSAPAGFVSVMKQFDVGLHFSYIAGKGSDNSSDRLAFTPMLLDVFYNIPLKLKDFKLYVYSGLGASLACTAVDRDSGTEHAQSFDFALRPGAGCDYFIMDKMYLRLDAGYFMCFESTTGMGLTTSFGVGYVY